MQKEFNEIKNEILKHENICIMSHKNADLDAIGSAVCMFQIVKSLNKDCYIYLDIDEENPSIERALDYLNKYEKTIYFTRSLNSQIINKNTLLIIVDTQIPNLLENEKVLEICDNVIIIDHHTASHNFIPKAIIKLINQNVSSVAEIMVDFVKTENLNLDSTIATLLLAGIEIDTNNFNTKTYPNTFKTAAFLLENGANQILKRKIKKESREEYIKKNDLIKKSFMVTDEVAICVLDNKVYYRSDLAEISEDLLILDNVEASFTIGRTETNEVSISARSLGSYDVNKIMMLLGGGGHQNEAAAQLSSTTVEDVKQNLISLIRGEK